MRIRPACSVNKNLFFTVFMALLTGTLFLTMSVFGENRGECIKGDCYNGEGAFTWPDGSKYVGEYNNGNHHGQGTYTFADGEVTCPRSLYHL